MTETRIEELERTVSNLRVDLQNALSESRRLTKERGECADAAEEFKRQAMDFATRVQLQNKAIATLTREHAAAVASCAVMRQVLDEIWEADEMGWITDGDPDSSYCECGTCGAKQSGGQPIVHTEECFQGKIHAATRTNCGTHLLNALAEAVKLLDLALLGTPSSSPFACVNHMTNLVSDALTKLRPFTQPKDKP